MSDLVFLLGVNFFGVYVRLQNEVAIRRAFLDRRECVEGNLLLRYARDQEVNENIRMKFHIVIYSNNFFRYFYREICY